MNRKLVGGLVAVLVVLLGVWLVWFRDRGAATNAPAEHGSGRSAQIPAQPATPPRGEDPKAPRGGAVQWSLDIDPEGPLRLEGQVIGPDKKPVAGAEVWLESVPPRSTTSEDDGSFAFDKLVGRTYHVWAKHGDLIGGPTAVKLTATSDPIVIPLAEGAAVKVTVVDEAKQGIAGAELRTGDHGEPAKTDAAGKATLKPLQPGWVAVEARAPGYAPNSSFTSIGSAGATGELSIVLHKGVAVSGHVVDEAGKPIAKVHVSLHDAWGRDDNERDPITTDAKGQFAFPALPAGTHVLAAADGDHAPARSPAFTVGTRPVTDVVITMRAGGLLAGSVVDAAGKPVAYATVRIAGDQRGAAAPRQATSDRDGTFEIRGLVRGKLKVRAESDTAASKLAEYDLTDQPQKRDVKLFLEVTGTIAGVVVDEKGAPVPEVQVSAFPDYLSGKQATALAGFSAATTDGVGAFTIRGLPDGEYRLHAARSGADREWSPGGTAAKPGDTAVRIVLPAPGGLRGKLALEGSGSAPALANVQIGWSPATPTSDGTFVLNDLTPGSFDVTFRGPEFAELVKRDVKIEPGKTTDLGTVTVMRGRTLVGKVVDASGRGVAGAKVKLGEFLVSVEDKQDQLETFETMAGMRAAVTDTDGAFRLTGIPRKATSIMADHPTAGRSAGVAIAEGVDDPPALTLTLRGYGSITGKVTSQGKPVANAQITDTTKGGGAQLGVTQTDDTGAFRLAKVPEGNHVLQAIQAGGFGMSIKSGSTTVQVAAGKEAKVTIDIPVGHVALTVQIKPLPSQQVDWAQVFVFTGTINPTTGQQLFDAFLSGGGNQGVKFWMGPGKPNPEFSELVPGDYSVCTIPITGGSFDDMKFQQRLQENKQTLKVYCKPVKLAASPTAQTLVQEVPAMTPLPPPPT